MRTRMEQMLTETCQRIESVNKELISKPEGRLLISTRKGRYDFIHVMSNNSVRQRRGINRKQLLVKELCRKRYLEEEAAMLEENRRAIEAFLESYTDLEHKKIIEKMPERFRRMPEEYYFHNRMNRDWTEKARKWLETPFEQSTYKPEEKDQTTASGLKVRSKSEVIIAEKLDHYMLPSRYEEVIYIEGYSFAPDFTILTKYGIRYWEHFGKNNDTAYVRKNNWKLSMYQRAGIVPWKNLIITYDDEYGGLDTRIIESEIINKLL